MIFLRKERIYQQGGKSIVMIKGCKPAHSIAWGNAPSTMPPHKHCAESATQRNVVLRLQRKTFYFIVTTWGDAPGY